MDSKTLATILFRIIGVSYFIYGIFYAPYVLFTAAYSGAFIISILAILTTFAAALCLVLLSKPLAALTVKGLDRNTVPPPPPPRFENQ